MWCGKCNNDVGICMCKDLDERMRRASDSPYVALRWCKTCDQYYARCTCETPDWTVRTDGKYNDALIERFP